MQFIIPVLGCRTHNCRNKSLFSLPAQFLSVNLFIHLMPVLQSVMSFIVMSRSSQNSVLDFSLDFQAEISSRPSGLVI